MQHSNLPKSRKDAKKVGSKFYYSGAICPRGHLEPRYTATGHCNVCKKAEGKTALKKVKSLEDTVPFSEEGLQTAVQGIEPGIGRIQAMIEYYDGCISKTKDKYIKSYIEDVICDLKLRIQNIKHAPKRWYTTSICP
jgi:hypothetical protein